MFRITLISILAFLVPNIVSAQDRTADSLNQEDVSSTKNEALAIMRDHMRSQLDWRSYFTHRIDVQRRARLSEKKLQGEPRAANVDQPR